MYKVSKMNCNLHETIWDHIPFEQECQPNPPLSQLISLYIPIPQEHEERKSSPSSVLDHMSRGPSAVDWNLFLRRPLNDWEVDSIILLLQRLNSTQLAFHESEDISVWRWSKKGSFSVKPAYKVLSCAAPGSTSLGLFGNPKCPSKRSFSCGWHGSKNCRFGLRSDGQDRDRLTPILNPRLDWLQQRMVWIGLRLALGSVCWISRTIRGKSSFYGF